MPIRMNGYLPPVTIGKQLLPKRELTCDVCKSPVLMCDCPMCPVCEVRGNPCCAVNRTPEKDL